MRNWVLSLLAILIIFLSLFPLSHDFYLIAKEAPDNMTEKIEEIKTYRTGEKIYIYSCYFTFPNDVVVKRSEGREGVYRVFPRKGEDFLYIIRRFPRPVDLQSMEDVLGKSKEQIVRGNTLIKKIRYEPSGNLWIWMVVRKEKQEYLDFYLSCEE